VAAEQAERGAILRRGAIKVVGRSQAAGAHHVLNRDRRVARNEPADMARDEPRRKVVAAARSVADNKVELAALVKRLHRVLSLPGGGRDGGKHDGRDLRRTGASADRHECACAFKPAKKSDLHPEERPQGASRRMAASRCRASILRDARKSALLRMRWQIF